jgi:hypothetical protein
MWVMEGLDARRMDRASARLGNSDAGLAWLEAEGLDMAFARDRGIGIDHEDGDGLTILHPARRRDGVRYLARFHVGWDGRSSSLGSGQPGTHWSDAFIANCHVLVVPSLAALWRLERALHFSTGLGPFIAVAPTVPCTVPTDWRDPVFWRGMAKVTILADEPSARGELLNAVGAAAGMACGVAGPPAGTSWRQAINEGRVDSAALSAAVEDALPLSHLLGVASDAKRSASCPTDIHQLDRDGRLMRLVRSEEASSASHRGGGSGERHRLRDVVVRSDGMLLDLVELPAPPGTPPSDRIVALSDGTRLTRLPPRAACSTWRLSSVNAFVAGSSLPLADRNTTGLAERVGQELHAATGLTGSGLETATALIMVSYVHQAVDGLRVPIFAGGTAADRLGLMRSMAVLSHNGRAIGRCRAKALAHLSDEAGGTLLLDEPGPLAGPNGPTEIGRFLLASCLSGVSLDHDATGSGGVRTLTTFGPRAVFAHRFGSASLGADVEVRVPLDFTARRGGKPDMERCQGIVDDLYTWAMDAVPAIATGEATVLSAIAPVLPQKSDEGPGRSVAQVTDTDTDTDSGEAPAPVVAEDIMTASLEACMAATGRELSLTHLQLEVASRGGVGDDFSPERLGRWLQSFGVLAQGASVSRRRLFGHISRIYTLTEAPGEPPEMTDPFDFCVANRCESCRYASVCGAIAPGIGDRKRTSSK